MKIEINKAINKAISKGEKLELWEHIYLMVEELKERIAELENELKPIWFVPEEIYRDSILKHNRVFKTKEEAFDYSKYKKAEVAIKKRIAELNKGWKPDWEDKSEDKCYVFYDTNTKFLIWCHTLADKKLPDAMYLKSWKLAKQLIDELESELLLFFKY